MAEGVRFELTAPSRESPVFKTGSLNRSDIPPNRSRQMQDVCAYNVNIIPYNCGIVKRFLKKYQISAFVPEIHRNAPFRQIPIRSQLSRQIAAEPRKNLLFEPGNI